MLKIAIVVQGLFEKSDSIGFDAVYQYKCFNDQKTSFPIVKLFAERFDEVLYPRVKVEGYDAFISFCQEHPDAIVVYHYCDGWPTLEQFLHEWPGRVVLRWHNNTPPWFYAKTNSRATRRTLAGFRNIVRLSKRKHTSAWVNSEFSLRQLWAIAGISFHGDVVYPASRYLDPPDWGIQLEEARPASPETATQQTLHVLFVSRVVSHKGHFHLIEVARCAENIASRPVTLHIAGRWDSSANEFNAALRAAAAASGVDVRFYGEVTDAQLRDLYLSADVFLCLSEHEGFGMPIFEAMRCKLPVVTWACTAFEELLRGHPFAFTEFDIATFAAAVTKASEPEVRREIIGFQEEILSRYSAGIVRGQLERALQSIRESVASERQSSRSIAFNSLGNGAFRFLGMDALVDNARIFLGEGYQPQVHDSSKNLVSLRDLDVYEHFISISGDKLFVANDNGARARSGAGNDVIEILAAEFFGREASKDGYIMLPGNSHNEEHAVFGPYVPIPEGRFEVRFKFRGFNSGPEDLKLGLDVCGEASGILRQHAFLVKPGASVPTPSLNFENRLPSDVMEFRVFSSFSDGVKVEFHGVEIRRLPMFKDLMLNGRDVEALASWPRPPATDAETSLRSTAKNLREAAKRILFPPPKDLEERAKHYFDLGDIARDGRNWEGACSNYKSGLELAPNRFEYLVQFGHALKESGHPSAAFRAYNKALELRSHDGDLHLHIGHLHKLERDFTLAETAYARSGFLGIFAIQAFNELRTLGLNESCILDFMRKTKLK